MPDEAPHPSGSSHEDHSTDEVPRRLVTGGEYAFMLDGLLGLAAVALGVWYGLRRPTIAVLAVALLLAGYVLIHVWQRYEEHPDRGRPFTRRPAARKDS